MEKNKVLILMATYNGEEYIDEQLQSIFRQNFKNWKLLIHDDGSIDGTIGIILKYIESYKNKIQLIDDGLKFRSAKDNFSHLINIAKNMKEFNYIMFADQDDVWLENKIEITLERMLDEEQDTKQTPVLVHTNLEVVRSDKSIISRSFTEYNQINPLKNELNFLLVHNTITGCTVMVNRPLLELYINNTDAIMHDYWLGLLAASFGKISYINYSTIKYRQHSSNEYGVKEYNLLYIFHIIRQLLIKNKELDYFQVILLQKKQSCAFLMFYRDILSDSNIEKLEVLCSSMHSSFFIRKYKIVKNKIFRYGLMRNLFFLAIV